MHDARQEPTLDHRTALAPDSASAPQSARPPSPPSGAGGKRRWLRRLLLGLMVLAVLGNLALAGLWWWSGRPQSLPQTLALVQRWLPQDYQLQFDNAQGSLRYGGKIGHLRFASKGLQLEIQELSLQWRLGQLLRQQVQVSQLHMAAVHIRTEPKTEPDPPSEPLQSLNLPVRIALPVQIDLLTWGDAPSAQVQHLKARYDYNGSQHQVQLLGVDYPLNGADNAPAQLHAQVQLQGAAPMQLKGSVQASLPAPPQLEQPITIDTLASITGTLGGKDAQLQLQAHARALHPDEVAAKAGAQAAADDKAKEAKEATEDAADDARQGLNAHLQATIRPWQAQPLPEAQATFKQLNLAQLSAQLPPSDIHGQVRVHTDDQGLWRVHAELDNALAGAWDQSALPMRHLQARAQQNAAQWQLQELLLQLPGSDGGQLLAQGQFDTQDHTLQAQLQLQQVNPQRALASLPKQSISGSLEAQADADQQVQFTLQLQPAQPTSAPGLRQARAQGQWQAPLLQLSDIAIDAWGAQLHSPQLSWNQDTQLLTSQEHTRLELPGASAQLQGTLGRDNGQGALLAKITEAQQVVRWINQLPGLANAAPDLKGQAQVDLNWQGGWASLLPPQPVADALVAGAAHATGQDQTPKTEAQLATEKAEQAADHIDQATDADSSRQASQAIKAVAPTALNIKGSVEIPYLLYSPPAADATEIKKLTLSLQGPLKQLDARLSSQFTQGGQQLNLDTAVQAQWSPQSWQARLEQLVVLARPAGHKADWRVALAEPVTFGQKGQRIQASAGHLSVTPPSAAAPAATTSSSNGGNGGNDTNGSNGNASSTTTTASTPGKAELQWQALELDLGTLGLRSEGVLHGIPLAWVDLFTPQDPLLERAGISGDLVLQGNWDIDTLGRTPKVHAILERASGDVRIAVADENAAPVTVVRSSGSADSMQKTLRQPNRGRRVRLQHFHAQLGLEGQDLTAQVLWASERAGTIHASVQSPIQRGRHSWQWPEQAPLSGSVQLLLPNIGVWASFAPPGWRVEGSLSGDVLLGGTRSNPTWKGELRADELAISSLLEGVNLKNGQLLARFAGNRLDIERIYLEGGTANQARILGRSGNLTAAPKEGGSLSGSGFIVYDPQAGGNGLQMDVRAQLSNLQVLVRADRQMGLSGNLRARMQDEQLHLTGALTVNRAALLLADASAPKLDSDVHVQSAALREQEAQRLAQAARKAERSAKAAEEGKTQPLKPEIQITVDLGPDFALQGYGLTTRLTGQLTVQGGPRITGEIHTVEGRYRAWGQSLDIEQGTIRFNGPYDNPSLNIIALRPNIAVRAGVEVAGSANTPRVQLYSDPVMPDAERLSWVVMGRDPSEGGAETAMLQQAALALLSGGGGTGNIAGNLGLDEIGFKGGNGAEGSALTLGKRISQDLYLAYEQSLDGAMGTLFIFYDLTKRLTLRGQTGENTAMDLIYTRRSKD